MVMTRAKLMTLIDTAEIEKAIKQAERHTSVEICVSISRFFLGDVRKAAQSAFVRLRVANTVRRNGILFFVIPARRKFVVLGDAGIHERVGQNFWNEVVAVIEQHFKTKEFSTGLITGIDYVSSRLSAIFPADGNNSVNELPDTVEVD